MDEAVTKVLAYYEARRAREVELQRALERGQGTVRPDELLLSVGPDTAMLLNLLAHGMGARSILEIGTSFGYSTMYLAEAARASGGKLITLELAPDKSRYAHEQAVRAGLEAHIDFRVGNALEILPQLPGPFDFVLIDLWKDVYIPCLDLIYGKLSPGALVAADNMISPEMVRADAERYRRHVRTLEFDTMLLSIGSGIELSRRR